MCARVRGRVLIFSFRSFLHGRGVDFRFCGLLWCFRLRVNLAPPGLRPVGVEGIADTQAEVDVELRRDHIDDRGRDARAELTF